MFRILAMIALVVSFIGTAFAEPSVNFDSTPEPIGRFNCEERMDQSIVLTATNSGSTPVNTGTDSPADAGVQTEALPDPDLHSIRIDYYINDQSCLDELSLSDCTRLNVESGGFSAGSCGCLAEQTAVSGVVPDLTYSNALGNDATMKAAFCGGTHTVYFIARTILKEDVNGGVQTTVDATSDAVELEFIRTRPSAPVGLPVVTAKEEAISVSLAESAPADIVSHQVCVKPVSNPPATYQPVVVNDETTREELLNGFEESDCRAASALASGSSYRYTGLTNDRTYDVAIYALDAADNPSPIGDVAQSTPQELLDFAEVYRDRLGIAGTDDHHPGELGGCNANHTGSHVPFLLIGLMGLVCLGLRRNN